MKRRSFFKKLIAGVVGLAAGVKLMPPQEDIWFYQPYVPLYITNVNSKEFREWMPIRRDVEMFPADDRAEPLGWFQKGDWLVKP